MLLHFLIDIYTILNKDRVHDQSIAASIKRYQNFDDENKTFLPLLSSTNQNLSLTGIFLECESKPMSLNPSVNELLQKFSTENDILSKTIKNLSSKRFKKDDDNYLTKIDPITIDDSLRPQSQRWTCMVCLNKSVSNLQNCNICGSSKQKCSNESISVEHLDEKLNEIKTNPYLRTWICVHCDHTNDSLKVVCSNCRLKKISPNNDPLQLEDSQEIKDRETLLDDNSPINEQSINIIEERNNDIIIPDSPQQTEKNSSFISNSDEQSCNEEPKSPENEPTTPQTTGNYIDEIELVEFQKKLDSNTEFHTNSLENQNNFMNSSSIAFENSIAEQQQQQQQQDNNTFFNYTSQQNNLFNNNNSHIINYDPFSYQQVDNNNTEVSSPNSMNYQTMEDSSSLMSPVNNQMEQFQQPMITLPKFNFTPNFNFTATTGESIQFS
jgi:hypothetical protein